jgi:FkbM family methyltransferase
MLSKLYGLVKSFLKKVVRLFPWPLTKNEYYDRLTKKIISKYLSPNCIAIDVGANEGKILRYFCAASPQIHFAFEPIPHLYNKLVNEFNTKAAIYNLALSNEAKSNINFNFVTTNPAYSGLLKRPYDKPEKDNPIFVNTQTLDEVLNENSIPIGVIKIDVEGAELLVLQGCVVTINVHKPTLLFEFGKKASAIYNYGCKEVWDLLVGQFKYNIFLPQHFLTHKTPLSQEAFYYYYETGKEYFFVAAF